MKTFIANVEERYVWACPYCDELCEDMYDNPEDSEDVVCEHCGEKAKCERTER